MPSYAKIRALTSAFNKKRWALLSIISILLHLLALQWATGNLAVLNNSSVFPSKATQMKPEPMLISLLKPTQTKQELLPHSPNQPKKAVAKKRPASRPKLKDAPDAMPVSQEPMPVETFIAADGNADATHEAIPSEAMFDQAFAKAKTGLQDHKEISQAIAYRASMPPSAELEYNARAERKGMVYQGSGSIQWESDGEQYSITGKAKVLFFTVSEFKSEGAVDSSGILPVRYMEKSGNKAPADTRFDQALNTISFSSSTISNPTDSIAQDRASIIWQLAAIGRGTPELFTPNAELEIFVAGTRNAEPWRIRILDEETIELDGHAYKTWHVKSVRQKGSKEKVIDVWFASEQEWYPVKLRHTEVNGDYLELSLTNMTIANH